MQNKIYKRIDPKNKLMEEIVRKYTGGNERIMRKFAEASERFDKSKLEKYTKMLMEHERNREAKDIKLELILDLLLNGNEDVANNILVHIAELNREGIERIAKIIRELQNQGMLNETMEIRKAYSDEKRILRILSRIKDTYEMLGSTTEGMELALKLEKLRAEMPIKYRSPFGKAMSNPSMLRVLDHIEQAYKKMSTEKHKNYTFPTIIKLVFAMPDELKAEFIDKFTNVVLKGEEPINIPSQIMQEIRRNQIIYRIYEIIGEKQEAIKTIVKVCYLLGRIKSTAEMGKIRYQLYYITTKSKSKDELNEKLAKTFGKKWNQEIFQSV